MVSRAGERQRSPGTHCVPAVALRPTHTCTVDLDDVEKLPQLAVFQCFQVSDFTWSHDGTQALIAYRDGFVLVGSVSGQRHWSSEINLESQITCGIWTPDDQQVHAVPFINDSALL